MRKCCHRLQTNRNTPSRFKIDFKLFKYNRFFIYNGYITFFFNFTGFWHFWGRIWRCAYNNRVPVRVASQRGHENEFCTKFWGSWTGGHIFDVVALGLKKHVFTAMLAQHVASEPRMRLWTPRCQSDRNTPSRFKIDFDFLNITYFLVITDITDFSCFYRFSTCLNTKLEMFG